MKKIIIIISILAILLTTLGFVYMNLSRQIYLKDCEKEIDDILFVTFESNIYYHDSKINIDKMLAKENDNYELAQIITVQNSRIYFVYLSIFKNGEDGKYLWSIGSVNEKAEEFITHFSKEFDESYKAKYTYFYKESYDVPNDYEQKSGYYYKGKIVLKDSTHVVEYFLSDSCIKTYDVVEYKFPKLIYSYVKSDSGDLLITNLENGIEKEITLEKMAETNEFAKKIYETRNEKINSGKSPIDDFFAQINILNDDIYILCQVRNWYGEAFAIAFKYDFDNNKFFYAGYAFVSDSIKSRTNLIVVTL